jgi:hypothetical protein
LDVKAAQFAPVQLWLGVEDEDGTFTGVRERFVTELQALANRGEVEAAVVRPSELEALFSVPEPSPKAQERPSNVPPSLELRPKKSSPQNRTRKP